LHLTLLNFTCIYL